MVGTSRKTFIPVRAHMQGKTVDVQVGVNDSADDRIQIRALRLIRHDDDMLRRLRDAHMFTELGSCSSLVWLTYLTAQMARDPSGGPPPPGDHGTLPIGSVESARAALICTLDFQIDYVNKARSKVGAVQNRLESALNNMETYSENLNASESRIRDADFAFETAEMSKFQVMQQAGVAILGQANGMSQGALRLI